MLEIGYVLLSLALLMLVAYRGWSVILFAPLCALLAVLLTLGPDQVLPFYSHVFMDKLVGFVQLYFPVFLLGAIFGKLVELSGAASAISSAIVRRLGARRAMLAIVAACALLTYGGVSLFVVAFAVYPFAATLFRQARLPKRLIPGTIALGAFTFTMDALPGSPQIQNVIPTTFFGTTLYAAPTLGLLGALFVACLGMLYLEWQRRRAVHSGEGYGEGHRNEPEPTAELNLPPTWVALLPLFTVASVNRLLDLKAHYGATLQVGEKSVEVSKVAGIWSIEVALVAGILVTLALGSRRIGHSLRKGLDAAVGGALLATLNTASEYGFGGVIASLPGFAAVKAAIGSAFAHPLVNEAVSINVLAGMTGSASGGMSIALAAMGQQYLQSGLPPEVLHRVASMASGGMDTLPHNGAVITLLVITGLTHRECYRDIFALTCIKTVSVFFVILVYWLTGWI
ncbi:MAG: GntP family permease [Candidatus Eremiobacterota bacterium]